MDCWKQNIASAYMVLLQVVVVYDRETTMHQFRHRSHHDVFHRELLQQKHHCVMSATNKKHQLSKEILCLVIKCCVLRAVTTLQHARKMTSLSNALIAVKVLHKTL